MDHHIPDIATTDATFKDPDRPIFFTPWETVFATSVYACAFRVFLIVNENASRALMALLGFDNQRLDKAQRTMAHRMYNNLMNRDNSYVVDDSCSVNDSVLSEQSFFRVSIAWRRRLLYQMWSGGSKHF